MMNDPVKTRCESCATYHARRVELHLTNRLGTRVVKCCGSCALVIGVPAALQGERVAVRPSYHAMIDPWTLGNGRYVADSGDARIEQTRYQNACVAFAERVGYQLRRAAVAARAEAERAQRESGATVEATV